MKALLIVDIQNDFLPGGPLGVPQGDDIIPVVNKLQKYFRLVVATQDWHPEGHGSFASAHEGKQPLEKTTLEGIEQVLWPDHCVQETPGAEFPKTLDQKPIEAIFRKGLEENIDSYSGFYDNGKKKSTGLADYLKGKGVKEVFVTGLAGDFCVSFTMLDALDEGFETWLVEDATRPIDADGFEKMKQKFTEKGGKLIRSSEIFRQ